MRTILCYYRRCSSGRVLKTNSALICSKGNNNCQSELIVTDLRLSKSGDYTLAQCNGFGSKEIKVTLFVEGKVKINVLNNIISCNYNTF